MDDNNITLEMLNIAFQFLIEYLSDFKYQLKLAAADNFDSEFKQFFVNSFLISQNSPFIFNSNADN